MNRLIATTAIAVVLASPAYATGNPPPAPAPTQTQGQAQGQGQFQGQGQRQNATSTSQGGNGGNATGGNQGQTQSTTVNNSGGGNGGWGGGPGQFPASSAYAPSFAVGGGECPQEAVSGGLSVFWAGISGGRVWSPADCEAMRKARYFRSLGNEPMAKAMECNNAEFRAAYKATSQPCPADVAQTVTTPVAAPQRVLNAGGLQCVDAAGRSVALGQPGSVRCQ